MKEFLNNHFAIVSQKLRCNACNEIISKNKSSIVKHVKSKKHKKGLADIAKNKMVKPDQTENQISSPRFIFCYCIGMFSHSYNACLLCREKTGQSIQTYSETHWWSKWEVLNQVVIYFGFVKPFLWESEEICPSSHEHLLEIVDNPQKFQDLHLELATLIDAGGAFCKCHLLLRRWTDHIQLL